MADSKPEPSSAPTSVSPPAAVDGVGARFTGLACPKCGYDLGGISEPMCPECGERFDPERIRNAPKSWYRALAAAWLTTLSLPVASFGLAWLSALVARAQLGHWPRQSLDDPKGIPGVYVVATASLLAFMLSVLAVVPSCYLTLMMIARQWGANRRSIVVVALAFITAWVPVIVQIFEDPGQTLEWLGD